MGTGTAVSLVRAKRLTVDEIQSVVESQRLGVTVDLVSERYFGPNFVGGQSRQTSADTTTLDSSSSSQHGLLCSALFQILTFHLHR